MKRLALTALLLAPCSLLAQGPNPPANAASQAEVDTGLIRSKFVSPYTAKRSAVVTTAVSNLIYSAVGSTNAAIAIQGGSGNTNTFTNATLRVVNPANGTGISGFRFGSGFLWQSTAGDNLFGFSPNSFNVYTNADFSTNVTSPRFIGGFFGNGSGLTNASPTTLFGAGTIPPGTLGSGSSITTKFLRGDSTWQTIAGGGDLLAANNLSDLASAGLSRTNLGANNGSNITAGIVAPARLGSGSGGQTKFLREDATWQTVSGSAGLPVLDQTIVLVSNTVDQTSITAIKELDGTYSLQWWSSPGGAVKIGNNPTTGTLHINSAPLTLDNGLAVLDGVGNQIFSIVSDTGDAGIHGTLNVTNLTILPSLGDTNVLRSVVWSIQSGKFYYLRQGQRTAAASKSVVVAAGPDLIPISTNQSFAYTLSGALVADQNLSLSISNYAATNIVATLFTNVFSISSNAVVGAVTIPAGSVCEYDIRFNGTNFIMRDFGPNNTNLVAWAAILPTAKQAADVDLDSLAAGITGLVKGAGNGNGYSPATAGTDYATHTSITNIYEFSFGETNVLSTGTAKLTWRAPHAMTLKNVRASLTTSSSSGIPAINIKEAGTTIFSTTLTIDANELTSTTAATAFVLSDTAIADDAQITFDIDTAGTGAAGLKVKIYYTR